MDTQKSLTKGCSKDTEDDGLDYKHQRYGKEPEGLVCVRLLEPPRKARPDGGQKKRHKKNSR